MIVFGEGPSPAPVVAIGEGPGKHEDLTGRPFVGRSGQLLERYWGRGGIPLRDEIFITNVVKERPPNNRTPTPQEIAYWLPSLCSEIESAQPSTILTFGATALNLFCDLGLESTHGIPHDIPLDRIRPSLRESLAACRRWPTPGHVRIFPSYHPAAALHDPTMHTLLTYDLERFGQHQRGKLPVRHLDDDAQGTAEMRTQVPMWYSARVAIDTEGWIHQPWGLSYSDRPGVGIVMRAAHASRFAASLRRLWEIYVEECDRSGATPDEFTIILHHALHDLPVLRKMGLDLVALGIPFTDTMVKAYLLGLEPQGLKPLGYRHCGVQMLDYSDLTAVSDERIAREWLIRLAASLPEPQTPKSKRKKSDPPIVEYDPITADLAYARQLIDRMLLKVEPLRKRWTNKKCAARVILEDELQIVDEMPLPTLDDVIEDHGGDERPVVQYAGADADVTRRIDPILDAQIDAYGLRDCLETTIGILPMVDRMQQIGMKPNLDHFAALVPIFDGRAAELDDQITAIVGHPINANSGDQVAPVLFDQLRLHKAAPNLRLKRTETGRFSTDDKALEALEGIHPIVSLIRARRECTTLKTRYAVTVPQLVGDDGRLHCELMVTRTDTGRLAAKNPNLLAFPKHTEWGMLIRSGFEADDGHEYGAWDLDQIEMRVFAHDANETAMIEAFRAGRDLHADTASLIYGRPYEDVLWEYRETKRQKRIVGEGDEQRFSAKATNFGDLMGITEYGLLAQFHKNGQLHWTLDDCRHLLAERAKIYPNGAAYKRAKHAEARRYSYVRDVFGRLRWLDGIHADDEYLRAESERMAQATPIQSGAQGITQRWMVAVWPELQRLRRTVWAEPLLQTHDELLFEYDTRVRETMDPLLHGSLAELSNRLNLRVPISAKGTFGRTWAEVSI